MSEAAEIAAGLSEAQRELARHALGLPNKQRRSYRNRFVASKGHIDFAQWEAMVHRGFAQSLQPSHLAGSIYFYLTRAGAEAALNHGETLDPEDFPSGEAVAAILKERDNAVL